MGCCDVSTSLWAAATVSVTASTGGSLKRRQFFCKPVTTIFRCRASSSSPSTGSYSRRWYNPLRRRPIKLERHWVDAGELLSSQERFTVLSYNILGDGNASKHKDLYPRVPLLYLSWDHRRRVICKELVGLNPDIICLQEVDKYLDLWRVMEKAGYHGSYKRRTGNNADGCALFWKDDKFRLLERESIEFQKFGLRDNVAQLAVLEMCRAHSRRLVIGNIHVLYNPSRGEVKLGQIRLLSSRAQILSDKWGKVPVILAGDYNVTPQSAIYQFLTSSELNIMSYDRRELSGQRNCNPYKVLDCESDVTTPLLSVERLIGNCWTADEVKAASGDAECYMVTNPLQLSSSYATVKSAAKTRDSYGEPVATSYHSKFLGTVDYLLYSDDLVPTRVLDTFPIGTLQKTGGLPCKKLGSDHVALASEFAFVEDAGKRQ